MNYVTGKIVKELREKKQLTQKELAEKLSISEKTISKWETNKGLPDIGILEDLSKSLGVSIAELLTGEIRTNENLSANMKKQVFYVCPVCGNVICSIGQGAYSCCGITLPVLEVEEADKVHEMNLDIMDGEYYVSFNHPMTKDHYFSFIAYVTSDTSEIRKLYPEQNAEARFRRKGHGFIYVYCNRHGLLRWSI